MTGRPFNASNSNDVESYMLKKAVIAAVLLGSSSSMAIHAALAADLDVEIAGSPYTVSASESFDRVYFGNLAGSTSFTDNGFAFSTTGASRVGFTATSDSNSVTFTGDGADWTGGGHLSIGYEGSSNAMTISDGATVLLSGGSAMDISLAEKAGSADNTLTVTGADTDLTTNGTVYVGRSGTGNTLTIEDGATVTTLQARIGGGTGSEAVSTGNSAVVDGAGSSWTMSGTMRIGGGVSTNSGENSLTVSDGAEVSIGKALHLGYDGNSDDNFVLVTGAGSKLSTNTSSTSDGLNLGFVDGSTGNTVTVTDAATLDVTGQILVRGANTLALADNATVTADALTMNAGSKFNLDVDAANPINFDVSGTASLNGTLTTTFSGALNKLYNVVTAGTVSDSFAALDATDLNRGFSASLSYTETEANLDIIAHLGDGDVLGRNQRNVADGLNRAFNNGTTLNADFVDVYGLQGEALQTTLNLMTGEANVYGMTVGVWNADNHLISALRDNSFTGKSGGWGSAMGASSNVSGDATDGTNTSSLQYTGLAGGMSFTGSEALSAGIAFASGNSNWATGTIGGGDIDHTQIGGFAKADFGAAYILAAGVIGQHDLMATRPSAKEGESLGLMAGLESSSAQIEAGYKIALNEGTTVTPYISFAMGRSTLSGSAHEDGTQTAAFALDYAAQSADLNTTSIGVRIAGTIGKATTFFSDIGLSDATRDGMTAAFTEAEGSEFNVNAAGAAGPQLNAAFGAAFQTGENSFASVGLGGSFLSGSEDLNGSLSFRHSW
jgi:T5SS/PEP-CTERM-associated repeat protein